MNGQCYGGYLLTLDPALNVNLRRGGNLQSFA